MSSRAVLLSLCLLSSNLCCCLIEYLTGVQRNAVHIACHFLGGVMLSRVVLYKLPSAYLWHVVLVAHLPSSCCTLDAARRLFLVRASPHRY